MATVGEPFLSPIPTGWKCSVCGKVNEPWVQQCPCEWRTIHVPDVSACDASARDNADARHDADDRLLDERNTMSNFWNFLNANKSYLGLAVLVLLQLASDNHWLVVSTATLNLITGLLGGGSLASIPHSQEAAAKVAAKKAAKIMEAQ